MAEMLAAYLVGVKAVYSVESMVGMKVGGLVAGMVEQMVQC
jgi:hypothetical protein